MERKITSFSQRKGTGFLKLLVIMLAGILPMVHASAQSAFTAGNIVAERVGDGSTTLSSASFPISFQEYSTSGGAAVQTINAFTSGNNSHRACVESGSAGSDGHLTLSADGRYLVFVAYDTTAGVASIVSATNNNINRVVGFVSSSGTVSTPTWFTSAASGAYKNSNIRAAYYDGTGIWASGDDGSGTNTSGIHYTTTANNTVTASGGVSVTGSNNPKNARGVYVYKGQLYLTTGTGTAGAYSVGSGKPATTGQTSTLIGATVSDPYDMILLDVDPAVAGPDLMYIANQSGTAAIYKFSYDGSTWTARGNASVSGATSLIANMNSSGKVDLYVVSGTGSANSILKYTDNAAATSTISLSSSTTIATAASNYSFRGISWAPTQTSASSDVTVSSGTQNLSGNYGDITLNGGTTTLTGNITVNGTLTINSGATLDCGNFTITSPMGSYGTFNLKSGGTLKIGSANGITNYTASGNVQTFSRFYSTGASYIYSGSSAQVTGDGLPATVGSLTVNNSAGVTLTAGITTANGITMTAGTLALGGNTLTYGTSATLTYNGTAAQTTGSEWPNAFSKNITISNTNSASGLTLGGNITGYSGTITVASGNYFNTSTLSITGTGSISFASGATLITANTNGVGTSNNAGIQLSGTVTYNSGMSVKLNGTSAQVTGTDIPASLTSLTLSNTSGITLSKSISVSSGTISIAGGVNLNVATFALSGNAGITFASGSTLTTANTNGVGSGNNAGIQLSGAVTYSASMSFVFNGSSAQVTGTDMPSAVTALTLNNTSGLTLSSDFSAATVNLTAGSITANGHTISSVTNLNCTGGASQSLDSWMPSSVTNLTVNNSSGITLNSNLTVTTAVDLSAGALTLGSNNLVIGSGASITGENASNYIFTNGSGALEMQAGTGGTLYPIGDSYNPLTISTTSGTITADVSVADGVTDNSNSAVTDWAVNRTWRVSVTSGSATISVTPEWNNVTDLAGSDFDISNAFVTYRVNANSGNWTRLGDPGPATNLSVPNSNFYSATSDNVTVSAGNVYYFTVGSAGANALPVKWERFNAALVNGDARLDWATASEENSSYFEVERSDDAVHWQALGTVAGNGTTAVPHTYRYIDAQAAAPAMGNTLYYRIKQVDYNNKAIYSRIRKLNVDGAPAVTLYPNPASGDLNIVLEHEADTQAAVSVSDFSGKTVISESLACHTGKTVHTIDISSLPKGIYFVKITTAAGQKTYNFCKTE